jgi:hypothetical protein
MLLYAQYRFLLIPQLQGQLVSWPSAIMEQQYYLLAQSMLLLVMFGLRIHIRQQILFAFRVIKDAKTFI